MLKTGRWTLKGFCPQVPPQPLWVAPGVANVRKLQELTYHLLHAGLWEELRQEVIGNQRHQSITEMKEMISDQRSPRMCPGNAEWLYAKIRVCGVSRLIQDLDQCSQFMDCTETGLVRDTLVLMRPTVDFLEGQLWVSCEAPPVIKRSCLTVDLVADASLFYTELLARLRSLATPFPALIGRLCGQCEAWLLACAQPVLIPKCSFLQPPGGALQHTLTGLSAGRDISPSCPPLGRCFTCCVCRCHLCGGQRGGGPPGRRVGRRQDGGLEPDRPAARPRAVWTHRCPLVTSR